MAVQARDYNDAVRIANAAGRDAGNKHAAKAEHFSWDEDDWNCAAEVTATVMRSFGHDAIWVS